MIKLNGHNKHYFTIERFNDKKKGLMNQMNKRIKKKKIKQKYIAGINHLSWYCELPKEVIIKEVKSDLTIVTNELFTNDEFTIDFYAYLDYVSIGLMQKYGTGWAGKQKQ